jgi:hypothetical protein
MLKNQLLKSRLYDTLAELGQVGNLRLVRVSNMAC